MFQVYFPFDRYTEHEDEILASADSVSVLYDVHQVVAIFKSIDDVPESVRDCVISFNELFDEAWKYRYLDFIQPIAITNSVYVYPTTKSVMGNSDYRYCIALNPKDAFGDGAHPTTRMCVQHLEALIDNVPAMARQTMSLCDIGTGTGIIAIAAYMFGIRIIDACDIESVAVERAEENARMNGCNTIHFFIRDITKGLHTKYNIVVANLLSEIIEKNIEKIVSAVKDDGHIIISGISYIWADVIAQLFYKKNCVMIHQTRIDQWCCFTYKKTHKTNMDLSI